MSRTRSRRHLIFADMVLQSGTFIKDEENAKRARKRIAQRLADNDDQGRKSA